MVVRRRGGHTRTWGRRLRVHRRVGRRHGSDRDGDTRALHQGPRREHRHNPADGGEHAGLHLPRALGQRGTPRGGIHRGRHARLQGVVPGILPGRVRPARGPGLRRRHLVLAQMRAGGGMPHDCGRRRPHGKSARSVQRLARGGERPGILGRRKDVGGLLAAARPAALPALFGVSNLAFLFVDIYLAAIVLTAHAGPAVRGRRAFVENEENMGQGPKGLLQR
mmetsp:Transcript_30303/g.56226  ORF Transcript_30303/g.56226 Transcript_30303/m.56226 type:complete len:222 (-) Transcript_30303:127-792(-)